MMADAEGKVVEPWPIVGDNELENHAETASGRRKIDLEALGKFCAVAVLRVAGP